LQALLPMRNVATLCCYMMLSKPLPLSRADGCPHDFSPLCSLLVIDLSRPPLTARFGLDTLIAPADARAAPL
jgi:hypothetical protein